MCKRRACPQCDKPGWTGCGDHVEEVLADVAPDDRCECDPPPKSAGIFRRFLKGQGVPKNTL